MTAIELAQPRTITIEDRGQQYALTIGVIPKAQWQRYFDGIISTSENHAGKQTNSFDSSSSRLDLVEKNVIDAQGYTTGNGGPVTAMPGWQKILPLSHRLAAGNAIISVGKSEAEDDAPITLGQESVFLDAIWGADETGTMRKFRGLRHSFQTPTAEHQRRYSRDSSRSRVIGGTRSGKTQWLGAQATLAELYDELILSVEGYTINGVTPGDRSAIVANMDTYHKVAAAELLFSPATPKVSEEEQ